MSVADELIPPDRIALDFRPKPRDTVAAVEVDGEMVLYDEDSGSLHLLDRVATLVWAGFDGRTTLGQLVDDLVDAFGADRSTVEHDVLVLTRDLGAKSLLEGTGALPTDELGSADGA